MRSSGKMKTLFDNGSLIPLLLLILAFFISYQFIIDEFGTGFFAMVIALILYIGDNILLQSSDQEETLFNNNLEKMVEFMTFGITSIIFGFSFYKDSSSLIVIILIGFFSISTMLSMARNWTLKVKNSLGWPIPFNGLFLPLVYYIYKFYIGNPGNSLFLFYFAIVGMLSASNYNFIGNLDKKTRIENDLDEEIDSIEIRVDKPISEGIIENVQKHYDIKENPQNYEEEYIDDLDYNEENTKKNNTIKIDDELEIDENEDFILDEEGNVIEEEVITEKIVKKTDDVPTETELKNTLDPPKMKLGFFSKLKWKLKKKEEPFFEDKDFPSKKELEEELNKKD